jgi:hypothetical protein
VLSVGAECIEFFAGVADSECKFFSCGGVFADLAQSIQLSVCNSIQQLCIKGIKADCETLWSVVET